MAVEMKSLSEATQAAADDMPHEHVCPVCMRKWYHSEPTCSIGVGRICPTVACLDEYLAAHRSDGITSADIMKVGKYMKGER